MSEQVHNAKLLCVLVVPLITVPQNKGQYMYDTQDQLEGLLQQMHGVAKGIKKGLEAVDIDNKLLKKKLVGCTFDDASVMVAKTGGCLLYTSPSPRDLSTSRMPSSA